MEMEGITAIWNQCYTVGSSKVSINSVAQLIQQDGKMAQGMLRKMFFLLLQFWKGKYIPDIFIGFGIEFKAPNMLHKSTAIFLTACYRLYADLKHV